MPNIIDYRFKDNFFTKSQILEIKVKLANYECGPDNKS